MLGVSQLRRAWGLGQPLSFGWWPVAGAGITRWVVRGGLGTVDVDSREPIRKGWLEGRDRWRDTVIIVAGKVDHLFKRLLRRRRHYHIHRRRRGFTKIVG